MTVLSTSSRAPQQTANGVNQTWTFNFRARQASDIVLDVTDLSGVTSIVTSASFSVSFAADYASGTITYPLVTPLASGWKVRPRRATARVQASRIGNQGTFLPQNYEDAIDALAMQIQEVEEGIIDVQTLYQGSGNVPAPTVGQVGQFYRAISTGVAGWAALVAASISDATTAGQNMLKAASVAAQTALLNVFVASGASNAKGLVPAPGATAGTTRALFEDATWKVPPIVGCGVRQTVLDGPVDTSGNPNFLPATSASLSLTSQNVTASVPLAVTAANGSGLTGDIDRYGQATSNLTWAGLSASTTNYLYVDVGTDGSLTPGSTTLAPTYQIGGTRSTTNGQFTFNVNEMSATVGNGSVANQAYRVFVGEAVTGATTVTSTIAYAYRGRAVVTASVSNTAGTRTPFSHNIGVFGVPLKTRALVRNLTAEANYTAGMMAEPWSTLAGPFPGVAIQLAQEDRNTASTVVASGGNVQVLNRTTGATATLTPANWQWLSTFDRGW